MAEQRWLLLHSLEQSSDVNHMDSWLAPAAAVAAIRPHPPELELTETAMSAAGWRWAVQ